jgi:hypothetical protein
MKKIICTVMVFAFLANVSAQLSVNSAGQVGVGTENPQYKMDVAGSTRVTGGLYLGGTSNFLGTINSVPVTFRVNGVISGNTGKSGTSNVSFGYGTLNHNTTGDDNTAIGYMTLLSNTTGCGNTANGELALYYNTTGSYNTANGDRALYYNTTGTHNTVSGDDALYSNTTGSYNTANGSLSLTINETGNYNTAIGCYADINGINQSNATAIGYFAMATSSNQVRIGNSSVTSIGGNAAWTNFSDGRAKKNIRADVPGLAFINRLQPVTYNLDLDVIDGLLNIDKPKRQKRVALSPELIEINKKAREAKEKQIQTGFVAQDVEAIAKSIGYDFSGVDVDEIGIYGLRYAEFVVPLVKAVQELSEQNERMQEQINELLQEKGTLRSGNVDKSVTGLSELTNSGAFLQQNAPNPFSQSTQIKFYLPESVKIASLNIYNLQGKQLKQIAIAQRGEASQRIAGSEFEPGIYLYALIADGQEIDVKRMILTE